MYFPYVLQFSQGLWCDWEKLGYCEDSNLVGSTLVDQLLTRLPGVLGAALPTVHGAERAHFLTALNACAPDILGSRFRADLRIYMEASKFAEARCTPSDKPVIFLITEDYKFFRIFVRSPAVERLLKRTTLEILGSRSEGGGVVVKLAGEVIPSL